MGAANLKNNIKVPQKFKIESSYDPAISLLGTHPRKMKTLHRKDTCTPMFTAVLLTIAKVPLSVHLHKWIKKL